MIEDQIRNRYKKLYGLLDVNSELNSFLENKFPQAFEEILLKSKKLWPGEFKTRLTNNRQLLSPSDFGFHNTLLTNEGLKFIDFEYFGWDDPVKLTCDFLLHPGMVLKDKQKSLWLLKMKRIFSDDKNKMNYSLLDIEGEILLISQFTLYGNCKKGNRPSFIKAATPKHAKKIYNEFVNYIKSTSINIKQGKFGAMMEVSLINDGPVTLILNSDD